jgi:hypothetical protein
VLLQGSSAPPTATIPHTQGSSTSPTATLACTQGSGTSLSDTLAHSYTPIVHLDPLLASIKERSRALMRRVVRENGLMNRLTLSLSRTLVTPTASASSWRRITRAAFSPLCSISRQPIWTGTRSDNFTRRSRDPRGRNADKWRTGQHTGPSGVPSAQRLAVRTSHWSRPLAHRWRTGGAPDCPVRPCAEHC